MVQVPIGWHGQVEGAEADVLKGLVINAVNLTCILYQVMGIVGPPCQTLWMKVPH